MNDYMKRLSDSIKGSFSRTIESKNLMSFFDNKVFIWQTCDQCVYCCRLRDETHITNIQVFLILVISCIKMIQIRLKYIHIMERNAFL
jgi:hypothetical protein